MGFVGDMHTKTEFSEENIDGGRIKLFLSANSQPIALFIVNLMVLGAKLVSVGSYTFIFGISIPRGPLYCLVELRVIL